MKSTVNNKQLNDLAYNFAKELKSGDIVTLNGELGTGKTTFVKALAKGLNITKDITSPTFSIVKEYDQLLCHIDAYRVFDEDINIDYYLQNNYIICIEWSENIINYLPYINYQININYVNNDFDLREIEIIKNK